MARAKSALGGETKTYTTVLSPNDEAEFQQWVKQNNVPWRDEPNADYDMRGYWRARESGDPNAKRAENLHFPDTWKTPYHKSFSNESIYSNKQTNPDNHHWSGDRLVNDKGDVLVDETPVPEQTSVMAKPNKPIADTAKSVASTAKGVAKTFLGGSSGSGSEKDIDYGPGPEPKSKTPGPPQQWYKDTDKHGLPSYKNGTDYVPETGPALLHEGEKVVSKENNMPPIDDEQDRVSGLKKVASALGSANLGVGPQSSEAASIAGKKQQIDEYNKVYSSPSSEPKQASKPDPKPAPSSGKKKAQYGDRPGEKRINTDEMRKPLGQVPSYKDGVDSVPEDGPAMLHEGEKVVPEDKNPDSQKRVKSALGGDAPKQLKAKKGSKKQVHKITVHRAANGGVVLEHHMGDGSKNEMHHHPSFDGAVNHMREHFQDSASQSEQGQSDSNEGPSMAVPPAAPQSTPNPQENGPDPQ